MNWGDSRTRIRRMLRDPDGNIWSDAFLLNLYNDEQYSLQSITNSIKKVKVIRIPPAFQSCYMFEWEWPYTDAHSGDTATVISDEVYRFGYETNLALGVCSHNWEVQQSEGLTPSTSSLGENYTQPWEAWIVGTPAEPPPIQLPETFNNMVYMAWDRKPVDPIGLNELYDRDFSWRSRSGNALFYYREDDLSNRIVIYPTPTITWSDIATEGDPDTAEYASSGLDIDNNLLIVYSSVDDTVADHSDESTTFKVLHKYLEYGVLERSYYANTDGHIESLGDYWSMRRKFGFRLAKRFMALMSSDRSYCFETQMGSPVRSARHPRLPDEFPAVYP